MMAKRVLAGLIIFGVFLAIVLSGFASAAMVYYPGIDSCCTRSCNSGWTSQPAEGCTEQSPCKHNYQCSYANQCNWQDYAYWWEYRCGCDNQCSPGQYQCVGNVLQGCTLYASIPGSGSSTIKCYHWSTANTCTSTQICDAGLKACCKASWSPAPSTQCAGTPYSQTDNCGTYYQSAYGTKQPVNGVWSAWSAWGACTNAVQTRTKTCTPPVCGGAPCYLCTGDACPGVSTETQTCCANECPNAGIICINSTTRGACEMQANGCTKLTVTNCPYGCNSSDTSSTKCISCPINWNPPLSDYCTVETVSQDDNCGHTQSIAGTKNCCKFKPGTALWSAQTILFGSKVNMTVNSTNCSDNEKINFTIYKYNALGPNVSVPPVVNSVIVNNFVKQNLTVQATWGVGIYFFNITLANNKSVSIQSPMLTATGSTTNCGDGTIQGGVEVCDTNTSGNSVPYLNGQTCISLQFQGGGNLACSSGCLSFNTGDCRSGTVASHCSEYGSQECNGGWTTNVAQGDAYLCSSTNCAGTCSCNWNGTACRPACTNIHHGNCVTSCTTNIVGPPTECTGDTKQITVQGTVQSSGDCTPADLIDSACTTPRTITAPCGLLIELPFFGAWQFIASACLIIAVYLFMRRIKN